MKKSTNLKYLRLLLFFITCNGFAQPITFSKIYNFDVPSYLFSVHQTTDSGYIASGYISKNYEDAFIFKLNKFGDTIWTKSFGYSYRDWAKDIQITTDGGYIVAGRKNYHTDMEHGNMYGDIWILKLNADGDTIWTKTYGGSFNDYANSIKQTYDGGYIVAGAKDNHMINSASDIWILKLNQNGDTIWTKSFNSSNSTEAKSIIQTNDSNYVFTGTGGVYKINHSGDSVWTKNFNSFVGNDIVQTNDSNYIAVGFSNNSDDEIIKLDEKGGVIWDYRELPYGGNYYKSNSLTLDKDGYIISAGQRINTKDVINIPDDMFFRKRSSNGFRDLTFCYDLSLHDIANSVEATNDGGFIIAGVTNQNAWLLKLDQNCEFALNVDSVYNLISGNWYKVFVCSGMTGKCDSVYSDDLNQIERIAGTDSIIWKVFQKNTLAYQSKYKISFSYSNIYHDYQWMLISDGLRLNIHSYQNSFSIGMDAVDAGGSGYSRNKSTVGIISNANGNSKPLFFPNPAKFGFSVLGVGNIESIRLFDLNGKLIESKAYISPELVDISKHPKGIYFVHVITKSRTYVGKIIKE